MFSGECLCQKYNYAENEAITHCQDITFCEFAYNSDYGTAIYTPFLPFFQVAVRLLLLVLQGRQRL